MGDEVQMGQCWMYLPLHVLRLRRRRPDTPHNRHCDGVTETLGMQHVVFRLEEVVADHLPGLSLLNRQMLIVDYFLHQAAVEQFPRRAPLLAMLHQKNMIPGRNQIRNVRLRPLRVQGALLVHELLYKSAVSDYCCGSSAEFERIYSAVLFRPFGELEVCSFSGDLVDVS